MWQYNNTNTLYHHGIKGQRWGVRRFQNEDGTLTPEGKKRYDNDDPVSAAKAALKKAKADQRAAKKQAKLDKEANMSELDKYKRDQKTKDAVRGVLGTIGTVAIGAAAVAGAVHVGKRMVYSGVGALLGIDA